MLLGLISDTHGHLDPAVFELFAGVDRILHAGDIGFPSLILELEGIAPVTAVLGNNDHGLDFNLTEMLELGGRKVLLQHIVNPADPLRTIGDRFRRSQPELVVFGHSHLQHQEQRGGVLFLNPGYSGKPRFNLKRSVATARLDPGRPPEVQFHPL